MNETLRNIILWIFSERAREIKQSLSQRLTSIKNAPIFCMRYIRASLTWKGKVHRLSSSAEGLKLHLGCGEHNHPGMLNCEYRATKAADVVMDCGNLSRFKDKSASIIFSHAFFEHLYKEQQMILLKDIFRVLKDDGMLIFMGIPDFQVIAEYYINQRQGIKRIGDTFDLYHVYRYTHGDPEIAPAYWLQQLHKSLFDKTYIENLLFKAGFKTFVIFNYCYPDEDIPLNLGFIASKQDKMIKLKDDLLPFSEYFANIEEIMPWSK